jgi:hypothetical protein
MMTNYADVFRLAHDFNGYVLSADLAEGKIQKINSSMNIYFGHSMEFLDIAATLSENLK